jgi:hypothetical protein
MDEEKKQVDESWKETIQKEKEAGSQKPPEAGAGEAAPEPDFNFFVATLAVQASIALGAMPNPVSQKIEINLSQAKLIIDTLGIIKDKTQGNLNAEEDSLLENILYELRMQYLSQNKGEKK